MSENTTTDATVAPDWRHVAAFLGLTFALTWLLNVDLHNVGLALIVVHQFIDDGRHQTARGAKGRPEIDHYQTIGL